jgi:hypothetical protein
MDFDGRSSRRLVLVGPIRAINWRKVKVICGVKTTKSFAHLSRNRRSPTWAARSTEAKAKTAIVLPEALTLD